MLKAALRISLLDIRRRRAYLILDFADRPKW